MKKEKKNKHKHFPELELKLGLHKEKELQDINKLNEKIKVLKPKKNITNNETGSVTLWGVDYAIATTTSIIRVNEGLTGSIPDTIGQLINLQALYLYGNQLTGSIPDLSGLTSLQYLYLNDNQLTGSIPDLSGLESLVELALYNNQLTGYIPDLSDLTSLTYLDLERNKLTGTIPDLSGLTSLQELWLSDNQLTGSIPDLSGLESLVYLYLYDNQLTGSIPDLSGLTSLLRLYVSNNKLSGPIPDNLPAGAYLNDNEFTGQIPASLASLTWPTDRPLTLSGNYLDLTNVNPAIQAKINSGEIEAALQWEPNKKPEPISKIWSSNSYLKAPNNMVTYGNYLYIADIEKGTISKINKRNPKQRTDAWWEFGDTDLPLQWGIKLYEHFIYVYSPSSDDIIKINLKNDESETWSNLTALRELIQASKTDVNTAGDLALDLNMRSMSGGFMYQLGRYTDNYGVSQVFVEKINLTDVSSHETVYTFPYNDPDTIVCDLGVTGVYGVLVDNECLFIMTLNKVTKVNLNTSSVSSLNVPANMNTCWGYMAELVVLENFLYVPSPMTRTILKINLEEFDNYAGESNAFKMLSDQSGPFTVFTEGLLAPSWRAPWYHENMAFTTDGKFFYIYNNDGNIVRTTTRGVPTSNICFPAGTPIKTDQGLVAIEKINTDFHTIDKQRIVDVTKTKTSDAFLVKFKKHALAKNYPIKDTVMSQKHKVLYKGKMREAKSFLGAGFKKVGKVSYNGEVLYNVLLDKHGVMGVNGMVCETLHPEHVIAKLFSKKSKYNADQREDILSYLDMCRKKNFSRRYRNIIKNC